MLDPFIYSRVLLFDVPIFFDNIIGIAVILFL